MDCWESQLPANACAYVDQVGIVQPKLTDNWMEIVDFQ